MAQKINLNVSPYYDDYDSEKNFYKVLYKPGFPVQARELTTQQSILQDQLESFGEHVFKEGSVVIPGGIAYDTQYNSVKLNKTNFNIDVSLYIKEFLGKKIVGSESGIQAVVKFISLPDDVNVTDVTLYVNYVTADNNSQINTFTDGETLTCTENVIYGNTTITANTPFASLISENATSIGSAAFISQGVYFVRGFFARVSDQTIILDHYTNTPSYRIGLKIDETLVNAKEDNSLFDNAKGFTNFAAPGADRLKINLTLSKKPLTDKNDTDFIELMRLDEGKLKVLQTKSDYNKIRDWVAERTFEESGDYSITPFRMGLFNSLNDNLGNNGIFFEDDTTDQGNTPSDDLMSLKISAGEAYVRGYNVEKVGTTIIDIDKPREVGIRSDIGLSYEMGNLIKVNNITKGVVNSGNVVTLHNQHGGLGVTVGSARAYSFNLEDAPVAVPNNASTRWELRLFDIQTNTVLTLNQAINSSELPAGSFVKGKNSGASGFAVNSGNGTTAATLNQTSGTFVNGEQIQINGVDFPRTIKKFDAYASQDIKSVKEGSTFAADVVLEKFKLPNNIDTVTLTNSGQTMTASGQVFSGIKEGDIIRFQRPGFSLETFNRVASINDSGTEVTLSSITDVANVFSGELVLTGSTSLPAFLGAPLISGQGTLYAPLPNKNVSTVDLTKSKIKITKKVSKSSNGSGILSLNISNDFGFAASEAVFEVFDQERYSIFNSASVPQSITNDTFSFSNGGNDISISNVGNNDNKTTDVTIVKNSIKSKIKQYNRSQVLNVTRSKYSKSGSTATGNGAVEVSDGLIFDDRYGLRVQDEEISLNYPDVAKFLAVYESIDSQTPTLDVLQFSSTVDVGTNAIIGENILSKDSKTLARVVGKPDTNKLSIVYLTPSKFNSSDIVTFSESNIETSIQAVEIGIYKDITNSFTLNKGQKDEFYDYSKLVRTKNVSEPKGPLLVVFDYYSVPSNDNGDVFTVVSYDKERYSKDIPTIGLSNIRATDTFDFRPRVSVYNPSTDTKSPFDFSQRDFSGTAIIQYLKPNESSSTSFEHYLPRIDKIYLNKSGQFIYEKGVSSVSPKAPIKNDELMELGTIILPPYLYNPQDALLSLKDNRRYTMRDIGDIEDRVTNLEETTTLSLLEVNAQTLQILDDEGKNRFKSGFFVDAFRNYNFINRNQSSIQINPDAQELIPFRTRDTLASQITPKTFTISSELDFNTDFELFDSNVKKTGNVITLNYEEVEWITQPYATKTGDVLDIINVNPYELPVFSGNVELDPQSDVWTRTTQLPDQTIQQTGTNSVRNINMNFDQGTTSIDLSTVTNRTGTVAIDARGNGSITFSNVDTEVQNSLVSSRSDDFMRSRNIQFISGGFVDYVELYLFLDGQRVFDIIPKLLEITPSENGTEYGSNGSFNIGEIVKAYSDAGRGSEIMVFRTCQPNHKSGAFNNPSEVYISDPYSSGVNPLQNSYTQSSTILNIDTKSLSEEAQGDFFGYLTKNTLLVGQDSGATAYVKDLKLISDAYGDLTGSCFLRDPHTQPSPVVKIQTGVKNFKLTTSPTNLIVDATQKFGVITADTEYSAFGTVEEWAETITLTTNRSTFNINGTFNPQPQIIEADDDDPLAQTFTVGGNVLAPSAKDANKDFNGAFITAVEVYFASVDTVSNTPIRCEIRTVTGDARPSTTLVGRSKTLRPKGVDGNGNEVNLIEFDSESASKATKFTFPEPIYLAPGNSYAFVLVAPNSTAYNVWTARHGGIAVNPNSIQSGDAGASLIYSTQYGAGSIFKSQNGALWTEDQSQDMTFKLYKAKFTSLAGSAFFNNPDLSDSNGYVPLLNGNPIQTLPKTGSVGITTNNHSAIADILTPGRKICGNKDSSTAVIVSTGSSVVAISTEGGKNYTTATNVDTFAITGEGSQFKLNITSVNSGVVDGISIVDNGTGYKVGDVIGIVTSTAGGQGEGARFTVTETYGIDTLYLTDIQAEDNSFIINTDSVKYFDATNTAVGLGTTGVVIRRNFNTTGVNAGNVMKVNHFNHGMYSSDNKVQIKGIQSDVSPTTLTEQLSSTDTTKISVGSTSQFVNFEGIPVSPTNIGYVKIGDELIGYQSINQGSLQIASGLGNQRGVDNTVPIIHQIGETVRKHEISGVSIRRLEVPDSASLGISDPIDLDSYHVTFNRDATRGKDRSTDVSGAPQLSFNSESFTGGSNVRASQNILYGAIIPRYDVLTPSGVAGAVTGIDASIRTITGTSVSGNEPSFVDNGFQTVQLNTYNTLDTVRLVSSKVNENEYLGSLPSSKSFTTILNLSSNDENISPIVRLSSGSETEFINHRLNNPIGIDRYDKDSRVNSIIDDPHTSIYISNTVNLNKPATSLKVLLTAFRPESSDFRVLYSLIRSDSSEVEQAFELFPGFNNVTKLDNDGFLVTDNSKNDGRPDVFVPESVNGQFREYQFTADNLPEFVGFTIKIVMSGTNQAQPPRIKELRSIAVK